MYSKEEMKFIDVFFNIVSITSKMEDNINNMKHLSSSSEELKSLTSLISSLESFNNELHKKIKEIMKMDPICSLIRQKYEE